MAKTGAERMRKHRALLAKKEKAKEDHKVYMREWRAKQKAQNIQDDDDDNGSDNNNSSSGKMDTPQRNSNSKWDLPSTPTTSSRIKLAIDLFKAKASHDESMADKKVDLCKSTNDAIMKNKEGTLQDLNRTEGTLDQEYKSLKAALGVSDAAERSSFSISAPPQLKRNSAMFTDQLGDIEALDRSVFPISETKPSPAPRKRKAAGTPVASLSITKKKKTVRSGTPVSNKNNNKKKTALPKKKKTNVTIEPLFATQELSPRLRKTMMAVDDVYFQGKIWWFDIASHLETIHQSMVDERKMKNQPHVNFKMYLVGSRDSMLVQAREVGLDPVKEQLNPQSTVSVPFFTVHVIEEGTLGDPTKFCISNDTDVNAPINGTTFSWIDVEHPSLNIKMLRNNTRLSDRSLASLDDSSRQLTEGGVVWFPPRLNPNNTNPFQEFELHVEGHGETAEDDLDINLDLFKAARWTAMNAIIEEKDDPEKPGHDPNWREGVTDMKTIRMKLWEDILYAVDDENWSDNLLHPAFIRHVLDFYSDELAVFPDDDTRFNCVREEAKKALEKFKPAFAQQVSDAFELGDITNKIKHFKIFPENDGLRTGFLHDRSLRYVNDIVMVKAVAVYPLPEGEPPSTGDIFAAVTTGGDGASAGNALGDSTGASNVANDGTKDNSSNKNTNDDGATSLEASTFTFRAPGATEGAATVPYASASVGARASVPNAPFSGESGLFLQPSKSSDATTAAATATPTFTFRAPSAKTETVNDNTEDVTMEDATM